MSAALGRDDGERETFHQLAASSWLGLGCAASGKGKVDTGRIKIISWDFLIICARVVQLLGARNDPISPSGLTPPACRAHWPPGGGRHEGRYGRVTELHRTPGRGAGKYSLSERWGGRGHGREGRFLVVASRQKTRGACVEGAKGAPRRPACASIWLAPRLASVPTMAEAVTETTQSLFVSPQADVSLTARPTTELFREPGICEEQYCHLHSLSLSVQSVWACIPTEYLVPVRAGVKVAPTGHPAPARSRVQGSSVVIQGFDRAETTYATPRWASPIVIHSPDLAAYIRDPSTRDPPLSVPTLWLSSAGHMPRWSACL